MLLADHCKKGPASAFATGWLMEELDHESAPGGKALGFKALIGWPSVEAHMVSFSRQDVTGGAKHDLTDVAN